MTALRTGSPVVLAVDGQVLQREGGGASLPVAAGAAGTQLRVVTEAGDVVRDWADAGAGALRLPTGGPYVVEQREPGGPPRGVVRDLLVGDLWVLAGQSNMQGGAVMVDLEPPGPLVRVFGMDRRWQLPVEPLHRPWHSPDPVLHRTWTPEQRAAIDDVITASLDGPTPHVGAGLGLAFANDYAAATGVPVGLVPTALGGTSLAEWSPTRPGGVEDALYASLLAAVRAAGGRVAGLLWHQGESETGSDDTVAGYVTATRAVFDALRADLGRPDLPVYLGQLGTFPILRDPDGPRRWSGVRLAQLELAQLGAQGVVATVDLATSDPIHLDAASQRRLGRRFARLACGRAQSVRVEEVTRAGRLVDWPAEMEHLVVRIRFAGLTGGLRRDRRASGFTLRDPQGALVPAVWRVEVDPADRAVVVVHLAGPPVEGAALHYGWGTGADSTCTLVDDDDNAVPAFGPIPL